MGDEAVMNGLDASLQGFHGPAGQLYRWDFSVFELHKRTGGRPLFHVTMALLSDQGLLDGWLLDRPVVERYLNEVEGMYKGNPYHNNTHAADVTQTSGVIMSSLNNWMRAPLTCGKHCSKCCSNNGDTLPGLSKLERFAIILASAVHDLGHPGVNNAFLVRTRDPQAVTYNDRSVNEMMHASLAFQVALDDPELNIFAAFSQADYELVRKLVLEMVLSTDMDVHFALLKRYEDALRVQPDVRLWASVEQRSLLFQMLVHLADLANPSRPWHLALKWAEWVVTEFLSQGEKEAAAGIPISPPCDVTKVCMPAAQLFFIERFMAPTLEIYRTSAPSFYDMASGWLADTQAKWNMFKAAGVKFPHQGYPALLAPPAGEQGGLWTTLGGGCCSDCKQSCNHPQQQQLNQQQTVVEQKQQQQQQVCKPKVAEVTAAAPPLQHQHQVALQQAPQQAAAQAAG